MGPDRVAISGQARLAFGKLVEGAERQPGIVARVSLRE